MTKLCFNDIICTIKRRRETQRKKFVYAELLRRCVDAMHVGGTNASAHWSKLFLCIENSLNCSSERRDSDDNK